MRRIRLHIDRLSLPAGVDAKAAAAALRRELAHTLAETPDLASGARKHLDAGAVRWPQPHPGALGRDVARAISTGIKR